MSETHYNILGVNEKATKDEIKKAYRTLSMKYHPDKNPGNPEAVSKFQKINEAYETLSDDQKRTEYDMQGSNPFMRMHSHGGHPGMDIPINEIFNAFFGGQGDPFGGAAGSPFGMFGGMGGVPPGANIRVFHNGIPVNLGQSLQKPTPIVKTLTVSLEQVLTGCTLPLEIERWIVQDGNKIFEHENLYITVPKGVDDNEIIILRDKGNIVNENVKGDVKVFIKVQNDTIFKRSGLDLILEKTISLKEALCGFSFEIKYVNGKSYTLNCNKGNIVTEGHRRTIPNMGLERENHTGSIIIIFHIEFPEKLTEEQINILAKTL